jgi:hypothetical protein
MFRPDNTHLVVHGPSIQFHTAILSARSPRDGIHAQPFPQLFRPHACVALTRKQSEEGSYAAAPLVFSSRHLLHRAYLVTYTPNSAQSLVVSQSGCCVILVLLTLVLVLVSLSVSPCNFHTGLG